MRDEATSGNEDEVNAADRRIAFERVYAANGKAAGLAGTFAHAIVLTSVSPEDWQFGEDADELAAGLVRDTLRAHPSASTVRVDVLLNLDDQYFEVRVTADSHRSRTARAAPRRAFVTQSVVAPPIT